MALRCLERVLARLLRIAVAVLTAVHESLTSRRSGTSVRLPPITNPLLLLSGVQLARKIRRREVTSVEVVQAYIDRIQEVNPIINAVVKHRFSEALQEAAQVDKLLDDEKAEEQELEARLPFLGVPFTAKEAFALRGMPNSTGLVSRRDVVSERDACSVALLKRAGAIPLAVTNCSELCLWLESHNRLYGVTSNPYDTSRIPGGSSGGEGSILASGGSIIGIGSDVGGSIRLPAFFNGIFGHKPTSGVVSNEGQHPPCSGLQEDFLATGPMCRYAMDLLPVLRIMAGANADKLSLTSEVDLKKLRYFSVPHSGGSPMVSPVDKQLIQAQRKVAETLETDLGVRVQELHIPQFKCSTQIWGAFMASPGRDGKPARSFAELMGTEQQKVWPLWEMAKWVVRQSSHTFPAIGLAIVEMAQSSPPSQFIVQQKEQLQNQLENLLGTDGILLYPSYPHVAPKKNLPLLTPFNFSYAGIFNILGLPVTQCPLGLNQEGLPLGVQVVAGRFQDHLTLAVARHLEEAFGGWKEPGAPSALLLGRT
ncbi:fatty-acid amide hydrolase 2-A-like isoform X4 [Brienomyrus brachyistius]|uniref:fatty-acid amide hydrolase 2-A-like isoform X4 n=1 Tax=Brienomyrus brachyistius TaxID=42636 RepID=UPI0020B188E0|nr:fatty-acid amide hydrolase 2-A-like isoform X4 [Brienomyrus brachyistius]